MGICLDTDRKDDINEDPLLNKRQQEEKDLMAASASQLEIHQDGDKLIQTNKVSMDEFDFIRVVGRGSFGKVMLVMYKTNEKLYAMKVLRKEAVEKRKQKVHTRHEREILESVRHPFIVQLHFAFQTPTKLYLITDFMIGGELFFHLRRSFKFNEERSKFYTAELVLALEYLHGKGIIYRDLKPENILIGEDGHIKITDFGLSKIDIHEGEKTHTFCGTPEYLAPEILLAKGHDKSVDWWSLGALLYEMLSGAPPFYSKDKTLMFKNRLEKPIEMKPWFSTNASSILQSLLCNDPRYRLGSAGSQQIKSHPFFQEIDWQDLLQKKIDPPFKPKVSNARDLRHFDPMFTDEPAVDTPVQCEIGKEDKYEKFTYQRTNDELEASFGKKNNNIEINLNFNLTPSDKKGSTQKS